MSHSVSPCKLIDYQDGHYGLLLTDQYFAQFDVFEANGRIGNGHDWAGVVRYLVQQEHPDWAEKIAYDPEASMFVARSSDPSLLEAIAQLIQHLLQDREFLQKTVQQAKTNR